MKRSESCLVTGFDIKNVKTSESVTASQLFKIRGYHSFVIHLTPHYTRTENTVYLSMAPQSFLLVLYCFFSLLILYTVSRTPWTGDQPVAKPLPTQRTTQT
jgi:hypothetical protein